MNWAVQFVLAGAAALVGAAALLLAWEGATRTVPVGDWGVYRFNVLTGETRICSYRGTVPIEAECVDGDPPPAPPPTAAERANERAASDAFDRMVAEGKAGGAK